MIQPQTNADVDLQNTHDPFSYIPPNDVLEILGIRGMEGEQVSIGKSLQVIPDYSLSWVLTDTLEPGEGMVTGE